MFCHWYSMLGYRLYAIRYYQHPYYIVRYLRTDPGVTSDITYLMTHIWCYLRQYTGCYVCYCWHCPCTQTDITSVHYVLCLILHRWYHTVHHGWYIILDSQWEAGPQCRKTHFQTVRIPMHTPLDHHAAQGARSNTLRSWHTNNMFASEAPQALCTMIMTS